LWDVARGALATTRLASRLAPDIVQARGDVAMAMIRLARLPRPIRRVYEARGLFADERVEIGSWRAGGWLDRAIRRLERANLTGADGLLCVMASAGLQGLRNRGVPLPPFRQLPNSVDLAAFTPESTPGPREFGVCYHGSLGGWYPTTEIVALARVASRHVQGRVLFLTPHQAEARAAGATADWAEVVSAAPQEVPAWLRRASASCFLIQPSPSKRASSPTKFAEALACGLPVLANGCSGDLDSLLEGEGVGVLVEELNPGAYERAAVRFGALVATPEVGLRCRALAERRYGLAAAAAAYHDLYDELLAATRPR